MRLAAALLACSIAAGQDFSKIQVEKVAGNLRFTDGVVWALRDNALVFSDVPSNRILRVGAGDKLPQVLREKSGGASGNAYDAQGRLYSCETRARRVVRSGANGVLDVIAEKWEGKRLNAPNDIVVSHSGHVYFTDPAFGAQADTRELDFYGVYHIPPKNGALSVIAKPKGRPNGIALGPGGKVLYVSNTDERNVRAYDLDKNGEPSNERVVISGIDGPAGGIRVDEKGNLWVAANGIAVYSAAGKLIHTIPMGDQPSNLCFGDPDFKTLYVTARGGVYRIRVDVKGAVAN